MHRKQRANQVSLDMVEPGIWRLALANGGPGVDLNFGTLTGQVCVGPVSDVLVHAGPDILGGNEALCGAYARVRQTMEVWSKIGRRSFWGT